MYKSYLADHGQVIGSDASLNIIGASTDASGNYTCTAHNDAGHTKHQFYVAVFEKPRFTQRPKSKSSPPSKTVRLNCSAEGYPEPKIRWLKNGENLNYTARVRIQQGQLVFSHTFTSDSGKSFSCSLKTIRMWMSFLCKEIIWILFSQQLYVFRLSAFTVTILRRF